VVRCGYSYQILPSLRTGSVLGLPMENILVFKVATLIRSMKRS
jgi:hypothetical protein